jgi:hypothetical protein
MVKKMITKLLAITMIVLIASCSKDDDNNNGNGNPNSSGIEIGDFRDGGVVFWINPDDTEHGLVCAITDQSSGAEWGCLTTEVRGAWRKYIGGGKENTDAIIAQCSTDGTAADIASNLTLNGYSDWYLPNKEELNAMEHNRLKINETSIAYGGTAFTINYYWSSTQFPNGDEFAYCQQLNNGVSTSDYKSNNYAVRSVRSF